MIKGKKILALIPARGGSKRIPKKNIALLAGKPLLEHTIDLAKKLPFDLVAVSSEAPEILAIAKRAGVIALERPLDLALDHVKDEPVLLHAIESFEQKGQTFDYIVMLQVTSPLRTKESVLEVIEKAIDEDLDVVATVVEDRSYFRTFKNNEWKPVVPDAPRRTQEREPFFKEAGVCYIMKIDNLKKTGSIFSGKEGFVIIDEGEAVDINTPFDLELVEFLINKKQP